MARPVRIEFSGAVYHAICRGNNRQAFYRDDLDRCRYLGCPIIVRTNSESAGVLSNVEPRPAVGSANAETGLIHSCGLDRSAFALAFFCSRRGLPSFLFRRMKRGVSFGNESSNAVMNTHTILSDITIPTFCSVRIVMRNMPDPNRS